MWNTLKKRWHEDLGYKAILSVSAPLILSTGSLTIQHFVDRMFLTWYSPVAIAAAMPASIINFTLMSLFVGTAAYVSTFTAQYYGAGRMHRIGPALWQGLYFSLLAGLAILPLYPSAKPLFALIGHDPQVQAMEVTYFQWLIFGGFPVTAASALSGFFSGRGKTRVVMYVSFVTTAINIILDYGLIFGKLGLPAWGIKGAALATVIAQYVRLIIYLWLIASPHHRFTYKTLSGWRLDREIFRRLIHYGLPSGVHILLEMAGFTMLILILGQYGTETLAASNITFNINHLAFMPVIGLSMGVSVLVGRCQGQNNPEKAQRLTWSAFHMASLFMGMIAMAYWLWPKLFLAPYAARASAERFASISALATKLLKFVAVYTFFDGMNIIFAGAIKGAGDTRFVMTLSIALSWLVMVVPAYLASHLLHWSLYTVWGIATFYIITLGLTIFMRFRQGRWKSMHVIEK